MDFYLWFPAIVAGWLVVLTHIPLGKIVLKKEVIFLDLAIAQAAALGVTIAHMLNISPSSFYWHGIAGMSAILMAALFQYLEKKKNRYLEAWIGCSFVLTASVGLWLASSSPHAAEHLKEVLMGQILWVTLDNLWITLAYYLAAAVIWRIWPTQFYLVFALCITASVQLVGVYLVFATLIMPALAMAAMPFKTQKASMGFGYVLAVLGYFIGMILSHVGDWPASPMIIFALAILTFMTMILSICAFRRKT